eukprot:TRINITY_DN914_c0_g1_i1.p1 TRINITY_DN914_c0_g1~~TRINITY_DN914_c0_g1_i1.p1  ORF type:complete len:360 (-),score=61.86 TRINITY_DN914_c0_g1_i1:1370-2449(-)
MSFGQWMRFASDFSLKTQDDVWNRVFCKRAMVRIGKQDYLSFEEFLLALLQISHIYRNILQLGKHRKSKPSFFTSSGHIKGALPPQSGPLPRSQRFLEFELLLRRLLSQDYRANIENANRAKLLGSISGDLMAARTMLSPRQTLKSSLPVRHKGGEDVSALAEDVRLRLQLAEIPSETRRLVDIFAGPECCARLEEKPGFIVKTKDFSDYSWKCNPCPYCHCVIRSIPREKDLIEHIKVCETFDQLLERLIDYRYDIAYGERRSLSYSDVIGRCWRIFHPLGLVGVAWDRKGQFMALKRQPKSGFAQRDFLTMTVYLDPRADMFHVCLKIYQNAKDWADFRELLEKQNMQVHAHFFVPR